MLLFNLKNIYINLHIFKQEFMIMSTARAVARRFPLRQSPPLHRWLLATVMIATIAAGWLMPVIGFVVPVVMLTAIGYSLRKGRYACGNVCPRGSFFDTFLRPFGGNRTIPAGLRTPAVRWTVFAGLMGFMAFQISRDPANPLHWGFVFWLACVLTTAAAIGLGLTYQVRTWCAVCPIGTLTATLGAGKHQLQIDSGCKACGLCETTCPMELSIAVHRDRGTLPHADCLKCSTCHEACPQNALHWPTAD